MFFEPMIKFLKYLAQNKKRMTDQRGRILVVVFNYSSPFTADDILSTLSGHGSDWSVSRSTLYRMLEMLEDCGLITKESMPDGIDTYTPCEALLESAEARWTIPLETANRLVNALPTQLDPAEFMEVDPSLCDSMHRTMIAGTCPWCGREIFNADA